MQQLNPVLEAARELQVFLESQEADFCFIGGLAIQRWGEPRFTNDTDASLLTRFVDDEKWIDLLLTRFQPRRPEARNSPDRDGSCFCGPPTVLVSISRWRRSSSKSAA